MALKASDLVKKGKGKSKGGKADSLLSWIGSRRKGVKGKKGGKHVVMDRDDDDEEEC